MEGFCMTGKRNKSEKREYLKTHDYLEKRIDEKKRDADRIETSEENDDARVLEKGKKENKPWIRFL